MKTGTIRASFSDIRGVSAMRVSVFVLSITTTLISIVACSGASGSNGGQGGAAATGASAGSGGLQVGGGGTAGLASGGDGGTGLTGCAKDTYTGELLPLDLFVMLDRSASMADSGKWGAVTGAINQFVSLPDLTKLGMGIAFFPTPPADPPPTSCATDQDCGFYAPCLFNMCGAPIIGPGNDSCVSTDYQKPVVAIADLPGIGPQITSAIAATKPEGEITPIGPALEGAIDYATVWAPAHPDHITAVVLATDGEPTGCSAINSVTLAASHADEGLKQIPSVKTFVIGIGDLSALNLIAQSGGTDQAILVSAGNAGQEFLAALNKIRGAIGCAYKIPTPPSGTFDKGMVNVAFTPEGQTSYELLKPKKSASDCMGDKGWYYDNPDNPSQILLCPASCDLVTNSKGKIEVVLGCQTIVT